MRNLKSLLIGSAAVALLCACETKEEALKSGLNPADFDVTYTGATYDEAAGYAPAQGEAKQLKLYTLKNANGMEVSITNFGGRIVSIMVPDKDGNFQDVVLGFDKAEDYFPYNNTTDFGAAIGRYANRINQGQLTPNEGETIQLPQNNFGHCLHGGPLGWQYQVYEVTEATETELDLKLYSPDGDNNFPGNVEAYVRYTLDDNNALTIDYYATTDKKTVINMTNHSYFNLNGDPNEPITNHILTLAASNFTPVDDTYMTTGEILPVEGTPMDFRKPKTVGEEIDNFDYEQLKNGNGYDHNWVFDNRNNIEAVAARLESPKTGIRLEVFTDQPGVQVYSGNFLDGTVTGKKGIVYQQRTGICLETQKYPDSPNKQWAESNAWVEPGEENAYAHTCIFKFSVVK